MPATANNSFSELPWSFVFDPVANARALADVQRRGLEAARQVVDRLLARMEPGDGSSGLSEEGPKKDPDLAQLWAAFAFQTMSAFSPSNGTNHSVAPGIGAVECSGGEATGCVILTALPDGKVEAGSFWLQNSSRRASGELRVQMGELRSPEGAVVIGLEAEPSLIGSLAAGSARLVTLSGMLSGCFDGRVYRGLIQVAGAPDVVVAVTVEVAA
jgi:hypothetical protein